ncbi:unnamed protein product [Enterobius vermicularis]|uniref:SHR-BD domain-containing protein n=1 Tax=Enterobius vermicularis TaxID=51028 RepID=A0A158QBE9_ENTVE|nr:unnamed protein product [Enterobius vermicularis]
MSFIGHVKQSIAKAIQFASDNTVFSELPECSSLHCAQTLSIKAVDSLEMYVAIKELSLSVFIAINNKKFVEKKKQVFSARAQERFLSKGETYVRIKFLIRNERLAKSTIMNAELISGRGFVVKTTDDSSVMDVRLSNKGSSGWFGKIIHPSQATIYKVLPTPGSRFAVYKTGRERPVLLVEKVILMAFFQVILMTVIESGQ